MAAVCDVAARAKRGGARVVLNAAPAAELPAGLLAAVDVLIVNAIEAAALAAALGMPSAPEAFAAAMHERHGVSAIVTLGARGALAAADGTLFTIAAPAVEVVDTTGAGDAFAGVLAAALDRGADWPEALAAGDGRGLARVHGTRRASGAAGARRDSDARGACGLDPAYRGRCADCGGRL